MKDVVAVIVAATLVLGPLSATQIILLGHLWTDVARQAADVREWLTLLVLVGQLWIIGRQRQVMSRQTVILNRQASISERAMTIGDEPRMLLESCFISGPRTRRSAIWPPSATYAIVMKGRTPASLRAIEDCLVFREKLGAPSEVKLEPYYPDFPNIIKEDGARIENHGDILLEMARPFEDEIYLNKPTTRSYFLVVKVTYDDVFGNQHEFGFCCRSDVAGGKGIPYGGAAFNYRRIRDDRD